MSICVDGHLSTFTDRSQSADHTEQKKSYRLLEEICAGRSPECKAFVTSSLGELQEQLLQSLSNSNPSSKAVS